MNVTSAASSQINSLRDFALSMSRGQSPVSSSTITEASPLQSAFDVSNQAKISLLNEMVRECTSAEAKEKLVAALSWMPLEAIRRVSDYGTKLEVFDKNSPNLPLYARHLQKDGVSGAYSPTANLIFVDQSNITPLVLLHEFSHALDRSLGDVSQKDPWQSACQTSRDTRVCIRPYATRNSAEYFADNCAASLIPDGELPKMLGHDWTKQINTTGLTREYYLGNHCNYSQGRQAKADPTAAKLVGQLWNDLASAPSASARPALTGEEYLQEKRAELARKKASEAKIQA